MSPAGGNVIRGEAFRLGWANEITYGIDPGTAYYKRVFGVVQSATIPDPVIDYLPIYALGTASKRDWYITYKGRITLGAGIPDNWLLDGRPLYLPIGTVATTGTDVGGGGGGTVAVANVVAGDTVINVSDVTAYNASNYVQIGTGTTAEVLQVDSVGASTLTMKDRAVFAHAIGAALNEVTNPYTHTVSEAVNLSSISMHVTYSDSSETVKLMRRFHGGKCNRATIEATEGDFLKMSLDEISFINLTHNQSTMSATDFYSASVADINSVLVYPTTQPYLFSYGSLQLDGTTFARIRGFRMEVNNNLDAKYYITNSAVSQLPYEYREGRRDYRFACQVDIEDASLFNELVQRGTYSSIYKGFQVIVTFTRGSNDTITITMPSGAPAAGGDAMGCLIRSAAHNIVTDPVVSVPLDIIGRAPQIVVVDSVGVYP